MVSVKAAINKMPFAKIVWLLKNAQNVLEITIIIWIKVNASLATVSYKVANTALTLIPALTAQ